MARPAGRRAAPRGRRIATLADAFEIYFRDALTERCPGPRRLREAMRYAALGPGKRLRPQLVLLACDAVGGDWFHALPAAVAVECVHAFSLVHDDLPAMDDDDYRRGRLTTHRKYGEALGVLERRRAAGLRLRGAGHARGRRSAPRHGWWRRCGGWRTPQAPTSWSAARPSTWRPSGGGCAPPPSRPSTSARPGRSWAPAWRSGPSPEGRTPARSSVLDDAGRLVGFAFQIHDDLLNAGSSLRKLGKRAGTDAARGKATYPGAAGAAVARRRADLLLDSARGIIRLHCQRPVRLLSLVEAVAVRER